MCVDLKCVSTGVRRRVICVCVCMHVFWRVDMCVRACVRVRVRVRVRVCMFVRACTGVHTYSNTMIKENIDS